MKSEAVNALWNLLEEVPDDAVAAAAGAVTAAAADIAALLPRAMASSAASMVLTVAAASPEGRAAIIAGGAVPGAVGALCSGTVLGETEAAACTLLEALATARDEFAGGACDEIVAAGGVPAVVDWLMVLHGAAVAATSDRPTAAAVGAGTVLMEAEAQHSAERLLGALAARAPGRLSNDDAEALVRATGLASVRLRPALDSALAALAGRA